jgi:hypothetical protein
MAHFAQLDENNVVIDIQRVHNNELLVDGIESEAKGIEFLQSLLGGKWIQTSYNNNIRLRYASIGGTYDATRDIFINPKPFPSFIFNETTLDWEAPTPRPTEDGLWVWVENDLNWQIL